MGQKNLAAYLQDHLAGSVAGINIVTHLIAAASNPQSRSVLEGVKKEIEADQKALKEIMYRTGAEESGLRKAVGWVVEKASWSKLAAAGAHEGELGWLEGLEALELGIAGKRGLWKALATAGVTGDFTELKARADAQIRTIGRLRLRAAKVAIAE